MENGDQKEECSMWNIQDCSKKDRAKIVPREHRFASHAYFSISIITSDTAGILLRSRGTNGQRALVPTRMSRRRECVTGMGACQTQASTLWISGRSRAPIQRITCLAPVCFEPAHSRKAGNSPSAREQT